MVKLIFLHSNYALILSEHDSRHSATEKKVADMRRISAFE